MKTKLLYRCWIILLIAICILFSCTASAEVFDLSGMSYDELIALKEQINLAIWNSAEWEEVEVPQGVYQVGVDIPAGHWTLKCADKWFWSVISWGESLSESGESIELEGRYSLYNEVYNKSYDEGTGATEYSCEVRNGEYIVIEYGSIVFMPYNAKPGFTFKNQSNAKQIPSISDETDVHNSDSSDGINTPISQFDHTVYEAFDSYSYDKKTKEWTIQGTTNIPMPVAGTIVYGDDKGINKIVLIVASDERASIDGIDYVIDGVKYTYEKISSEKLTDGSIGMTVVGNQGVKLVEALGKAQCVDINIHYKDGKTDSLSFDSNKFESFLSVFRSLVANSFDEYMSKSCLSDGNALESLYPLTIKE